MSAARRPRHVSFDERWIPPTFPPPVDHAERERLQARLLDRMRELADECRGVQRKLLIRELVEARGDSDAVAWPNRMAKKRALEILPVLRADPEVREIARRLRWVA